MTRVGLRVLAVVVLACALGARADGSDHKYKEGDHVPLYANKVGPFHNPSETYRYYDLPFCAPEHPKDKREALGEVLNGDRLVDAPYELNFKEDKNSKILLREDIDERAVLLLTGFLATILMRVLKNDFIKYSHEDESLEDQEETGWKYIHGDVFRFPQQKSLFAAIIGSGTQLLALAIFIFLLAIVGVFYPYNRGALFTALVVIYALTSGIAGYTATSFYLQLEGTNWVRNLILTGCLFCGPLFLTFSFLNTVAIAYSATAALPFGTIIVIILIWALVTSPLLVLGGIAGKNSNTEFQAPCRTTKYPREIPQLPWYRSTIPQMAMAGFLPFSAIYIELYYIFASIWGHKIYTIYSILFIVFIILIIVTAFVTVALTYFQLAVEDHEWWWRSVLCGGSTGIFIFFYCIYYYHARSDMSGFMQTSFFFGYMTCVCYGFFLMLGTVGFRASLLFVRHIYRSIKCE
ncbi:hypothetical protein PR202_ga30643 [Eleusine coracana subsp. coracana]|uniref:Transmembrane 9 superfamily member n=1 Tax=Eleusine coracana subsp. coracana TaxID=191504 RepID=A0AAV5DQ67_ELECO|nr:hypothetical protein PR202_ga30643 [Eleusine coracana subsp. coracana]